MDCISETIGSEFSENFISIYLIIVLFSIVVIYLRGRLLITHCHSVSANFFSEFASAHSHPSVPYLSEFLLSSADLLFLFFGLDICHHCIFALSKLKQLESLLLLNVSVSLEFLNLSVDICSLSDDLLQDVNKGLYYH